MWYEKYNDPDRLIGGDPYGGLDEYERRIRRLSRWGIFWLSSMVLSLGVFVWRTLKYSGLSLPLLDKLRTVMLSLKTMPMYMIISGVVFVISAFCYLKIDIRS